MTMGLNWRTWSGQGGWHVPWLVVRLHPSLGGLLASACTLASLADLNDWVTEQRVEVDDAKCCCFCSIAGRGWGLGVVQNNVCCNSTHTAVQ